MPKFMMTLLVVAAFVLVSVAAPVSAAQKKKSSAQAPNPRYASIVIDADTGVILHESNADKRLHPASLVKMMTLLMAFERLQDGTMTLNQRIRISEHAASQSPSKLGLRPGSTIAVKDAIYALVTKSANDIAVAMGEHIGGSESRFATLMTARAQELGMSSTRFKNASGLHHIDQVSSARDIARLSRILIKNYPQQYKYFSTRNFKYNGASYHNHNRLMESYNGMDGIKTGYIGPSGFNLAASAVRGDRRLIAVVFGGRSTQSRNAHVAELLDRGFAKIGAGKDAPRIADAGNINSPAKRSNPAPVPGRKPVVEGTTTLAMANTDMAMDQPEMSAAMNEMIGEGDIDPAIAKRFETGMMAIAAIKGVQAKQDAAAHATATTTLAPASPSQMAAAQIQGTQILGQIPAQRVLQGSRPLSGTQAVTFHPEQTVIPAIANDEWSVQVGAYTSRVRSDQALSEAIKRLPPPLQNTARPVIVPLKAGDGWVFRARIRGLSREQASAACKYFDNCMAISPRAF